MIILSFVNKSLPVLINTKPLKAAKAGSSGELVKAIQEANSKLLSVGSLLFTPQYPAHIIYQSASKGILSLYVIAGDAKDGEAITKALASGNEAEVEKAAAENGTVGVLLWRPAQADSPAVRVLISGTSSMARIQQSLDKAAKALPFLNAATVKSKDALTAIPAPAVPRASAPATAKTASSRPTTTASSVRSAASSGAAPTRRPTAPVRPTTAATKPAAPRPAPTAARTTTVRTTTRVPAKPIAPVKAANGAPVRATNPAAPTRAAAPASTRASSETVAQKKTVGKVQAAAPVPVAAKKSAPATPVQKPVAAAAAPPQVVLDDSVICLDDERSHDADKFDIVVIPPTPEPPREVETVGEKPSTPVVDQVEPEIPPPVDAFKKPSPEDVGETTPAPEEPKPATEDVKEPAPAPEDVKEPTPAPEDVKPAEPVYPDLGDIIPAHPEPSAPAVPADHVIIATEDPAQPDIAAAVPFVPAVPRGKLDDGLIQLDDVVEKVASGFEFLQEPLIPQAPREDGTLADCSEEVSKLVEISMDTDKSITENASATFGEVNQLVQDFTEMHLDEATNDYVRKLSNQMIADAQLPFTSALASSIVSATGNMSQEVNGNSDKPLVAFDGHDQNNVQSETEKLKHDLMQSRSSVVEHNGAPVEYEKADPAIDDILAACVNESEKFDAAHSTVLHMPAAPGVALAKIPRFARPYFFDLVTVPHNDKLETTLNGEALQEFISKVRSRNYVLPSKDISSEQLDGILQGKQHWANSGGFFLLFPTLGKLT
uniref:Uncharacterized protein n=1 Tax=Caenorhabditis japonica TaxID=281687 RepID=A0A8R1DLK1_CAEJA